MSCSTQCIQTASFMWACRRILLERSNFRLLLVNSLCSRIPDLRPIKFWVLTHSFILAQMLHTAPQIYPQHHIITPSIPISIVSHTTGTLGRAQLVSHRLDCGLRFTEGLAHPPRQALVLRRCQAHGWVERAPVPPPVASAPARSPGAPCPACKCSSSVAGFASGTCSQMCACQQHGKNGCDTPDRFNFMQQRQHVLERSAFEDTSKTET